MKRVLPYLVLIGCVGFLINQMLLIEIPLDAGDGLTHFFIANYALEEPLMYLDHWGKPFFTLLASPFSVFGFKGVIVLNLFIFMLTSWMAFLSLRALNVSVLLQAVVPIALLYSYDYTSNILSGLTEILAGFVVLLSGYFLIRKKWIWMAVCVSILPFCRSEGQLIIVLGIIVLIYNKQYRTLPFLLSGFVVYAFIGLFAFGDFFWYLSNDPYPTSSPYGNGSWKHFWNLKQQYLGVIGLTMLIFGCISFVFLMIKKQVLLLRIDFLFFGFAAFFGILSVHAFLWTYGLKGSLGLTRVITIGLPILVVCMAYLIQQLDVQRNWIQYFFVSLLIAVGFYFKDSLFKVTHNAGLDRSVLAASEYVRGNKSKTSRVFYYHPLFAFGAGANPVRQSTAYIHKGFQRNGSDLSEIQYGDIIVRDSHFGPVEMGLPLSVLEQIKELVLINEFLPSQPGKSYHGENWSVKVYQKIPLDKQQQTNVQKNTEVKLDKTTFKIKPQVEFIDIVNCTIEQNSSFLELEFKAEKEGGFLNCDINEGETWSSVYIRKDEDLKIRFPVKYNDVIKLYFWNPNKIENKVEIIQINLSEKSFHPIIT